MTSYHLIGPLGCCVPCAQSADAHTLFADLRGKVNDLLRLGAASEPAPLLPLLPGLEAQLVTDIAPRLVNDALVRFAALPLFIKLALTLSTPYIAI